MPYVADSIWVNVAAGGLTDFTVGAAIPGYRTFAAAAVPNNSVIHYTARTATEFENGEGIYNSGTGVVTRVTIFASSNGGAKVNFGSAPTLAVAPLAEDVILVGTHTIGVPAGAWKAKAGANGATPATYGDLPVFSFNGTTHSRVRWLFPMPKSWDEGTFRFQVGGVCASGASGNVAVFKMACKVFASGAAPTVADLVTGAQSVSLTWAANDTTMLSNMSAPITVDGVAQGALMMCELWRDPADGADNNANTFSLFSCRILYGVNEGTDEP